MFNTMMQRHIIGKKLPLLSTIELDLLKQKAREKFEREKATVKKKKEKQ